MTWLELTCRWTSVVKNVAVILNLGQWTATWPNYTGQGTNSYAKKKSYHILDMAPFCFTLKQIAVQHQ